MILYDLYGTFGTFPIAGQVSYYDASPGCGRWLHRLPGPVV